MPDARDCKLRACTASSEFLGDAGFMFAIGFAIGSFLAGLSAPIVLVLWAWGVV